MAPLPISHRPLSDSRDTSMSNSSSRGGGAGGSGGGGSGGTGGVARGGPDSSADSASAFSLPMRSQRTSSAPDSPVTLNGKWPKELCEGRAGTILLSFSLVRDPRRF